MKADDFKEIILAVLVSQQLRDDSIKVTRI